VVVGATGHRVLGDPERVEAGIAAALAAIRERAAGRPLRVLSALAEGADRLVARCALAAGDELWAILPLPRADYVEDFTSRPSRDEFATLLARAAEVREPSSPPPRPAAYSAAGRWIVGACDLLLAAWDGRSSQGLGGTAELVALARQQGIPLVRVHAGNRRQGSLEATTLGAEEGAVSCEGWEG